MSPAQVARVVGVSRAPLAAEELQIPRDDAMRAPDAARCKTTGQTRNVSPLTRAAPGPVVIRVNLTAFERDDLALSGIQRPRRPQPVTQTRAGRVVARRAAGTQVVRIVRAAQNSRQDVVDGRGVA